MGWQRRAGHICHGGREKRRAGRAGGGWLRSGGQGGGAPPPPLPMACRGAGGRGDKGRGENPPGDTPMRLVTARDSRQRWQPREAAPFAPGGGQSAPTKDAPPHPTSRSLGVVSWGLPGSPPPEQPPRPRRAGRSLRPIATHSGGAVAAGWGYGPSPFQAGRSVDRGLLWPGLEGWPAPPPPLSVRQLSLPAGPWGCPQFGP